VKGEFYVDRGERMYRTTGFREKAGNAKGGNLMCREYYRGVLACVLLATVLAMTCSVKAVAAGSESKVNPPRVVQVYPSRGMEYVPVDTSIHIVFSGPMDELSTIQAVTISPAPELAYPASWQFLHNKSVLVITPLRPLRYSTTYRVTVHKAARDQEGIELNQDYEWSFTTSQSPPSPVEAPRNGGFSTGDITGWKWAHTEDRGARETQWKVVPDKDREHVLCVSRPPTFEMGTCSLEQAIDAEVPVTGLVFLSFDVLIGDYTLKQYAPGDTYPMKVIVTYLDKDGREHSFVRAYYYYMPVEGGVAGFAEFVEAGKWTQKSYNLSMQVPRPSYIKSIKFEFCGWAWLCMLDNVRFVW